VRPVVKKAANHRLSPWRLNFRREGRCRLAEITNATVRMRRSARKSLMISFITTTDMKASVTSAARSRDIAAAAAAAAAGPSSETLTACRRTRQFALLTPKIVEHLLRIRTRWTILTCAEKLTSSQLNLPHGTKQKSN